MSSEKATEHAEHFEALFRAHADPWGYDRYWHEDAKRRAVTASLVSASDGRCPGRVLEVGCGNGASTEALARWCRSIDAIDGADAAIRHARERLEGATRCRVWRAQVPEDLPTGPYDGIVATEVLYYMPRPQLQRTLEAFRRRLASRGCVVVTASIRPFADRDVGNTVLFGLARRVLGRPIREVAGGPWRLCAYRPEPMRMHRRGCHARTTANAARPDERGERGAPRAISEEVWVRE